VKNLPEKLLAVKKGPDMLANMYIHGFLEARELIFLQS